MAILNLSMQEAEDNDYNSEDSDSESTDSDISIDENDDVRSDVDDEDEPKRKRRVVTKAYKVWGLNVQALSKVMSDYLLVNLQYFVYQMMRLLHVDTYI